MTSLFLAAALSYLLGSIPSGYLAGRLRGVDLRASGSGNIGATNALRVLGKRDGYIVFAADFLKGIVGARAAIGVGVFLRPDLPREMFAATGTVAVVLGHMFPVWLRFQGGKGIATSGGVMIAVFPWPVFVLGLLAWLIGFFSTRYVSVASLASAVVLPTVSAVLALFGQCHWMLVAAALILSLLAIWRHRPNIKRLLDGTEQRFQKSAL